MTTKKSKKDKKTKRHKKHHSNYNHNENHIKVVIQAEKLKSKSRRSKSTNKKVTAVGGYGQGMSGSFISPASAETVNKQKQTDVDNLSSYNKQPLMLTNEPTETSTSIVTRGNKHNMSPEMLHWMLNLLNRNNVKLNHSSSGNVIIEEFEKEDFNDIDKLNNKLLIENLDEKKVLSIAYKVEEKEKKYSKTDSSALGTIAKKLYKNRDTKIKEKAFEAFKNQYNDKVATKLYQEMVQTDSTPSVNLEDIFENQDDPHGVNPLHEKVIGPPFRSNPISNPHPSSIPSRIPRKMRPIQKFSPSNYGQGGTYREPIITPTKPRTTLPEGFDVNEPIPIQFDK